ncbi:hypothetical protein [Microbaculum sp. FT89]|uniref:hypothetical protein n=1 Tax=Microbaculum sp. FT89 TaxID=3447298 RepID=UPI003F53AB5F
MKRILVFLAIVALTVGIAEAAKTSKRQKYRVLDLCSWSGNPGDANPCSTIVKVHNLSKTSCSVRIRFFRNDRNTPVCTIQNASLAGGKVWCASSREAGSPEPHNCTQCSPQLLDFSETSGYAIVDTKCARSAVQATINVMDPQFDLDILSIHRVEVVPLN